MMREHIAAIEALLAPLGYQTYYGDVIPKRDGQGNEIPVARSYILLWGSNGTPSDDRPLGRPDDLTDLLGVTCVAATSYGVLTLRAQVRSVLNYAQPNVPGRFVELHLFDSQRTQVDRDVTPHVPFGIDQYRLTSVPA